MSDELVPLGVPPAPEVHDDAAVARVAWRLSGEYALRVLKLSTDTFGDVRRAVIALTILAANTAHLDAPTGEGWRYARNDSPPPDEVRRPTSISSIADALGLPFETTRRHVSRLIEEGASVRVGGGVIVPTAFVLSLGPVNVANVGYVRKFVRDLGAIGVVAGEEPPAGRGADDVVEAAAVARVVSRLSSAYVLRVVQLLVQVFGDIRPALVAQTIFTANKAHLDARHGEGWRYAGVDEPPPDDLSRPVSVARVAQALGLPYETARAQVRRLIADEVCVRVGDGLIVPQAAMERPAAVRAMLENVGFVRKFLRDLRAVGFGATARSGNREKQPVDGHRVVTSTDRPSV
jgi:DNA-binding Lrp family transcriptional regulator